MNWPKFFADINNTGPVKQLEDEIKAALLSIADIPHASFEWTARVLRSKAAIQAAVRAATTPDTFAPLLDRKFMNAIAKDTPEEWDRFSLLKTLVIGKLLPQRLLETLQPTSEFARSFVEPLLTQVSIALCSLPSPKPSDMPFLQLHHQVLGGVKEVLFKQICHLGHLAERFLSCKKTNRPKLSAFI